MTGVPTSRSRRLDLAARAPSRSGRRSPSRRRRAPRAAPGSGPCVSFRTDRPRLREDDALPGPSRNLSTSFGSRTRAGPPSGPAFERFFVPNFPRANVFAQLSRDRLRDDLVHEADLLRALAVEDLPREDDVEGVREADDPRQARRAAPRRQDAELDLGKADLGLLRVGREPPVHRERRLAAAAHAGAVDGGDRRERQVRELAEDPLPAPDRLGIRVPVGLRDLVHVGAGDEDVGLGRDEEERLHVGPLREVVEDALELPHDGRRVLVHLLAGRVEDEDGEAVRLDREAEG